MQAAFFGGDPNWGRIIQAVGQAVPPATAPACKAAIAFDDLVLVSDGVAVAAHATTTAAGSTGSCRRARSTCGVRARAAATARRRVYFSDLTYDYVTVNSEYN